MGLRTTQSRSARRRFPRRREYPRRRLALRAKLPDPIDPIRSERFDRAAAPEGCPQRARSRGPAGGLLPGCPPGIARDRGRSPGAPIQCLRPDPSQRRDPIAMERLGDLLYPADLRRNPGLRNPLYRADHPAQLSEGQTDLPGSGQPTVPAGGEVEYDMYRAKGTLWQVAKVPGQPVQYLQMDASRVERQAAANPIESFQKGFAGTGTDENLLRPLASASSIIGEEVIEGHPCWVMETRYTEELIEAQVQRYPTEIRGLVRQQLGQIGLIRNWIGKQDTVQWRMESFTPAGQPLLAMMVLSIKPNANLQPDDLRMRVPKGTVWVDITDMVTGGVNQMLQGQPLQQQQLQQQAAKLGVQTQPQATYNQVPATQPQQTYQMPAQQQPSAFQSSPQQQMYAQPQQQQMWQMQQPAAQPSYQPQVRQPQQFQQTYVQQGNPGAMPQQQMMMAPQQQQMMMQQQPQQQSGGGFLSRLFGGGRQQQPQQQMYSGYPPQGNQQMMVPVINGQPQIPYQGR